MISFKLTFFSIVIFFSSFEYAFCANGFISAAGTRFVDEDCKEYIANGWNSWEMIEAAMGLTSVSLEQMMDDAVGANMNTFRMFAHGHDPSIMQLQYSPGQYNEAALQGLDKVLALASERGLKAILSFADNWKGVDSKLNYMQWSGYGGYGDEFYSSDSCKQYFKDHMNHIVNRKNTVNGRIYRNDPTIFAWNLINEPRCNYGNEQCMNLIQTWIDEMAGYLKSIDSNHMITVGQEGFYGWHSGKEGVNPDAWNGDQGGWAMQSGQNFYNNHASENIDFAGIHIWVDNWDIYNDPFTFFNKWIDEHANDARFMNKPLLIEEFGKIVNNEGEISSIRDPYFDLAYTATINSIKNNDVIRGVMWWEWEGNNNAHLGEYDIKTYHSTWNDQIAPKSKNIVDLTKALPRVQNCIPEKSNST